MDAIKPKNTTKLKHPGHSKPVPASKSAPIKLKPSRMGWFLVVFFFFFGVPSRFLGFPYSPWIWWDVYTWVHMGLLKFDEVWWSLSEFDEGWWDLMASCLLPAFSFQKNGDHFGVNPEGCNFIVHRNCCDIRGSNSIVHFHHASTMRFAHAWALKCGNRMFPYKIGTSHGRSLQNWNPWLTNEKKQWLDTLQNWNLHKT